MTDVLAEVDVVKSESGGATVEAVFHSSRKQSGALSAIGFAWCKEDGVSLRAHPHPGATVADLVSIDAVRATFTNGNCVLRARAYLCQFAFSGINQICKADGFSFCKGVGWSKQVSAEEYDGLQALAGTRSNEAAERRRMQAEEAAAAEKLAAARERAAFAKAVDWQDRVRKDPSYARRSYEYGQLLKQVSETGSFAVGSDGAPNWPDPPVPGEKGIVSKATEHLVPPRPQWTGGHSSMYAGVAS